MHVFREANQLADAIAALDPTSEYQELDIGTMSNVLLEIVEGDRQGKLYQRV